VSLLNGPDAHKWQQQKSFCSYEKGKVPSVRQPGLYLSKATLHRMGRLPLTTEHLSHTTLHVPRHAFELCFSRRLGQCGFSVVLVGLVLFVEFLTISPGYPHPRCPTLSSPARLSYSKTPLTCLLHCK